MWFSSVLCMCWFFATVKAQNLGGFCRTPTGESGKCLNVYKCDPIISLLRAPSRTKEQTRFITNSKCGFDSVEVPYVCCGSGVNKVATSSDADVNNSRFTPNPEIPGRTECGVQSQNRIFNGEQTAIDEFPWMAIIQFLKPNGSKRIACAGTLINQRYVLTAAHCITGEVLVKVGQPINVRLGEYDTSSPGRDCFQQKRIRICNQPEINAGIEELIPHPSYNGDSNRFHDIALIRLDREITYSDYVQPICLPEPNQEPRSGELLIVAGWGKTEKGRDSNVKLKLQVPVTDTNSCMKVFNPLNVQISKNQICAGGEDGRDSCTGDSGGPLMGILSPKDSRWMIQGIVSFGFNFCGTRGYPGVYTKVANYVPWIHRNVKP